MGCFLSGPEELGYLREQLWHRKLQAKKKEEGENWRRGMKERTEEGGGGGTDLEMEKLSWIIHVGPNYINS